MADTIWVLAPQRSGRPLPAVLELVTAATRFAGTVEGFSYGEGVAACAPVLGAHGMSRLFDLGPLGDALAGPRVSAAMAAAIASHAAPDAIFIPSTYDGRDVAARLSAKLDLPVIANVVGLTEQDGTLVSEHAILGGAQVARARFTDAGPAIFLIRPKSFSPEQTGGGDAVVEALEAPAPDGRDAAQVVARQLEERDGPSLDGATVVVSGGRGLGLRENYALVERLAGLLHGAPGASRAIVDAGWVPYAYQIGQTGKTVKPEVYLACGISGATQHLVGMNGARHVIAINKDPTAPIFQHAELGVVGDVTEILPRLIRDLEAQAASGPAGPQG